MDRDKRTTRTVPQYTIVKDLIFSVFEYHTARFEDRDKILVLFGGDFNAVPHTDGGESPASVKMLENGFTDAFRSLMNNLL